MKAIVYHKYGSPDELKLEEVTKPVPKENEVLVKVYAASINSWDRDILKGTPLVNRLMFGLLKPKTKILGCDIAGRVEAVGVNVKQFRVGDEVFGDISGCGWGGFAEYVCTRENTLTQKPVGMTFEQAAAIPQAGVMALQSLYDNIQIRPGKSVLMNGAGGGVGTFAIQIAKSLGAEVTGVDSAGKLEMLHALGADHVIDYAQEDFTRNGLQYDLIIDVVGNRSVFDYKRALAPGGSYRMVGGTASLIFQAMFLGPLISKTGTKKTGILVHRPNKHLDKMNALFEAGKVCPVIDTCYPMEETAEAFRYFGKNEFKGKIVISMQG